MSFYVLEGIDGSGKSSQALRLGRRIERQGIPVAQLVEPTHCFEEGREIRARAVHGPPMTAQEELDLFIADRRKNVSGRILPALDAGDTVVQDRYFYSTACYQSTRPELGLGALEVVEMHNWAPLPTLVIVLDVPVELSQGRLDARGDSRTSFEDVVRQTRVRDTYNLLRRSLPPHHNMAWIDGTGSEADVAERVWEAVQANKERR